MDGKKTENDRSLSLFERYKRRYLTGEKSREELNAELKKAAVNLAASAGAFFLAFRFSHSQVAFSSVPLGYAYMASLEKYTLPAFLGLLLGAVTDPGGMALPLTLIYTALFLGRILVFRTLGDGKNGFALYCESNKIRLIETFSAALFIAAYRASASGFLIYDVFGAIVEVAAAPLCVLLNRTAFSKKERFTEKGECAFCGFLFITVFSLRGFEILGFSFAYFAAALIALCSATKGGIMRGGTYGLFCGIACGMSYSPVFAIIGIVTGLLRKTGSSGGVVTAVFFGTLGSLYVGGVDAVRQVVPELLGGALFFALASSTGQLDKIRIFEREFITSYDRNYASKLREKELKARFDRLSEAFSSLSKTFFALSDRQSRINSVDARGICDEACDEVCSKCSLRRICWDREYSSSSEVFSGIARQLIDEGHADRSSVAGFMRSRCTNLDKLLSLINEKHGATLEKLIRENKAETLAFDYETMGRLIEGATKKHGEDCRTDEKKSKKLTELSKYIGFYAGNISVYGSRRTSVAVGGIDLERVKASAEKVRKTYGKALGVTFDSPEFELDGDYVAMSLKQSKTFEIDFSSANREKEGESFSGDCISMFETKDDYFYSLISDGMGSGSEAALTSRLCAVFLRKMLEAGNSKPVSLEMLNNFLRSKNTECFATVDLLEIDLLNGKASFIKGGAASSYVLRGDKIFKITSNTFPFGIVKKINAEEVKFELKDGDVIVMVSDGAVQTQADSARLCEILATYRSRDLASLADDILSAAKEKSERPDDISVGVIRANLIMRPEEANENELTGG